MWDSLCPFDINSHINDRIKENNEMMWTCEFNFTFVDIVSIFNNKYTLQNDKKNVTHLLYYA